MKTIKKLITLCLALCLSASTLSAFACNKTNNDSGPYANETLEIFVVNAGYGTAWLTDTIEEFKKQEWVQQKYPNLKVLKPASNTSSGFIDSKMTSGLKANTFDLMFSCPAVGSQYEKKDSAGNYYFEDLNEDVFNATIPGEGVTVKSKMNPQIYAQTNIVLKDKSQVRFAMPWINGMMGFMYNKDKIDSVLGEDYVMPRTTNEFVECVKALKTGLPKRPGELYENDAPFIFAGMTRYFNANFQVWWAQYEGLAQYENFWNGKNDEGTFSKEIFAQTGRLRSLEVCESLVEKDLGYNHELCTTGQYQEVQANFLIGRTGVFMPVGDWLITEAYGMNITAEIRMMKTPVISSIVEKLSSVKTDEQLAYVVQCVDEQKDYETAKAGYKDNFGVELKGVELKKADYDYVKSARNMMYRMTGHEAFIPSYALGKEVAKDFLIFMASDIGIKAFGKSTYGHQTPYNYTPSEEEFNSYCPLQQDHHEYIKTAVLLPPESIFQLNYMGGVNPMTKCPAVLSAFAQTSASMRKSALKVFNDDINHYTDATFNITLQKANLI